MLDAIYSCFAAWSTWCTLWAVTIALAFILAALHFARHKKKPKWLLRNIEWLRTFYVWLGALAILGGTWAFFLPIAINSGFGKDDDGPVLRQLLIYTVGGLLGVITLGETHRKNNLEKDKNDQDHTRQVHAERRSRYTKAIEHLFNENISVRLGGVYSLAGLADEWLTDEKTLRNEEERRKETQNIINNLCAYIRSPFPLAERANQLDKPYAKYLQKDFDGDKEKFDADKRSFARDKAALEEERQVRKSIIKEIRERLQDIGAPGPWSKFDYDFSNAHFFYDINFENSHFIGHPKFTKAIFAQNSIFSKVKFINTSDEHVVYIGCTDFSETIFKEDAMFNGVTFKGYANFQSVKFFKKASFENTNFNKHRGSNSTEPDADFRKCTFYESADFRLYIPPGKSEPHINFTGSKFSITATKSNYIFDVDPSGEHYEKYKNTKGEEIIKTIEQNFKGVTLIIPKGATLFDPNDIYGQEYDNGS
ncbi:pentapeptide repeat-containing protein [Rothia dentocariosa]|uniref:pentapeptide repeat-containing protein n=1 Tax=Rothia dentocariosa TaxID=2047 RepID=UPI0024909AD0|nr:pentapeptide repeat-containing protein [Rothia dentocariosa]